MNKLFPKMRDCPEGKQIALGGVYWVVYQIVLPFMLLFLLAMFWGDSLMGDPPVVWGYGAFYLINLICVAIIFRSYLKDSFWTFRLDRKKVFVSVGMGLAVLVLMEIPFILLDLILKKWLVFFSLPIADPVFYFSPSLWFRTQPLVSGACLTILAPVAMCCLYYGVGFAAPAQQHPWLGYLIVALLAAIPVALMYTSGSYDLQDAAIRYFSILPFHLCACWVYQRSDTIWGPIVFQALANLLSSPVAWLLSRVTYHYHA